MAVLNPSLTSPTNTSDKFVPRYDIGDWVNVRQSLTRSASFLKEHIGKFRRIERVADRIMCPYKLEDIHPWFYEEELEFVRCGSDDDIAAMNKLKAFSLVYENVRPVPPPIDWWDIKEMSE